MARKKRKTKKQQEAEAQVQQLASNDARTLAQRGAEGNQLAVCRFEYNDEGCTVSVGGVGSQTEYIVESSSGADITENGDLLEGFEITDGVMLKDAHTSAGTLQDLLSSWNTTSNARLLLLRLNNGAEGHFELGVEDYVTLPFSTAEPVAFNIGDYVDLAMVLDDAQGNQFAKRYEVCEFPKPALNVSTGGYDYELRLDAYYMKWRNKIFRYIPTEVSLGEQATGEASWSLTATLATHVEVLLRNLTSLGYTYGSKQEAFGYSIDATCDTSAKLVTYDGMNIIDALSAMAETFDCEWWVTDNVINFGKCEHSDLVQVEIGVEAEQMSRTDSQGTFATRLYAFGAERNLQSDYRSTEGEVLINGVVQRRLMLPESVPFIDAWRYNGDGERVYTTGYKLNGTTKIYVGEEGFTTLTGDVHICGYTITVTRDANGKVVKTRNYVSEEDYTNCTAMTVEEVIEGIIQTDDIYPRQNDTVAQVSTYWKVFDNATEGDNGTIVYDDIDPIYAGETFDPDEYKKRLSSTQYLQPFYRVKSTVWGEAFDESYIMDGETLSLVFSSGNLNGMEFEVMFLGGTQYSSPDGKKWFELVANDTYGRTLPDELLHPEVGEEFVLYNWQALDDEGKPTPEMQTLIDSAEQELLAYAIEYLQDTMVDDGVYETELNPAWVWDESSADPMVEYRERTFAVGQRVMLVNDALFDVPRESRVVGFVINIDIPYDHPTYKVGESVQYSRIGAVESKVNQIAYNGGTYTGSGTGGGGVYLIKTNDNTSASDSNAYSALRSQNVFIRKDTDDITNKKLTVNDVLTTGAQVVAQEGVQFGRQFETGLLGWGGRIDGDGNGELDSLSLRKWLEVPEIRYNRTTVTTGITWQTVGAGKIESVEIDVDETTGEEQLSGTITLKLEDGEIGAVALHDLCMGVFHDFEGVNVNETENSDEHNGNFKFAGFGTVYFQVTEILESDNSRFRYVLRETSDWTAYNHPRPYMDFACYANTNDTERQSCIYQTTDYLIALQNMSTWTYGDANIYYIRGKLDGFEMSGRSFTGTGVVIGNGYFYGTLQQFENAPYYMEVEAGDDNLTLAQNDTRTIDVQCHVYKGGMWDERTYYREEGTSYVTQWGVTRSSGSSSADTTWNNAHTSFAGTISLTYSDLNVSDTNKGALFTFAARLSSGESVEQSIYISATADGTDGRGIDTITEYYAVNNSATTEPLDSAFGTSMQTMTSTNRYLWNYTLTTFTDGDTSRTNKVIIGVYGDTGETGSTGVSITGVTEWYVASSSATTKPAESANWQETMPALAETNKYLWNKEEIHYSDGTSAMTEPAVIGMYSADGRGITGVTEHYLATSAISGVTWSTSGWQTDVSKVTLTETDKYLWNYETITYDDGSTYDTDPVIIGAYGDTGDDGITFSVPSSLIFGPEDNSQTVFIGAWRAGESLLTSSSQITLPSSPQTTVVSITGRGFDSYGRYVVEISRNNNYTYVFDWDAEFGITIDGKAYTRTVNVRSVFDGEDGSDGDDGEDGIMFLTPAFVNFSPTTTAVSFYVAAWRGGTQLITTTSQVTAPSSLGDGISSAGVRSIDASRGVLCEIVRKGTDYVINWTGDWSVTIEGVAYPFTVTATSVANGEKGDNGTNGTNGANAVYYHVESSANNATYYPARGAFSPESVTFTMYQTNGSTTSTLACYWYVTFTDGSGGTYSSWWSNSTSSSITVPFDQGDFLAASIKVQACERADTSSQYSGCERTVTVTTSCAVRFQVWDDVATNFRFEDGSVGCTYIDIVQYGGSCYQCATKHTKTTSNYPGSSTATSNNYWTGVNYFENVATNLLLANTAKIENLYVDDVYMESSGDETKKTALWISPEHDGMKIMKMGDDWHSGRENTESNNWSNPTTWFHGGNTPTVDDVYSSNATSGSATLSSISSSSVSVSSDASVSGENTRITYTSSGFTTTSGAPTTITIPECLTVSVTDGGLPSSGTTKLAMSQVRFEVRIATSTSNLTSNYTVIRSFSVSNDVGGTTSATMGEITYSFTPTSSSMVVGIYRVGYDLRAGGSFNISSHTSVTVRSSAIVEGYVSQFGANGVFIGYRSDSYFRLALDSNSVQHTLLAGGYGLDVTEKGVLQYSGGTGNKMPVGGTLLLGHFTVSGSVKGTVWTFDGQAPTLSYISTGCWQLSSPAWSSILGASSSHDYCVTVTPVSSSNGNPYTARAYNFYVNSNGNFQVNIASYNGSTLTDVSCFVRIDFIGSGSAQTLSISSADAKSADAKLLEESEAKE